MSFSRQKLVTSWPPVFPTVLSTDSLLAGGEETFPVPESLGRPPGTQRQEDGLGGQRGDHWEHGGGRQGEQRRLRLWWWWQEKWWWWSNWRITGAHSPTCGINWGFLRILFLQTSELTSSALFYITFTLYFYLLCPGCYYCCPQLPNQN